VLLGREFHLDDTLTLWDAIFAHDEDFRLVEYICVAMLQYIRHQLLAQDFTGCMRRLLTYPPVEDVHVLVTKAVQLCKKINSPQKGKEEGPITSSSEVCHVCVGVCVGVCDMVYVIGFEDYYDWVWVLLASGGCSH